MWARGAEGFDGPLTVTLEGKDGAVYGQAQITGLKTAWSRFSVDRSRPERRILPHG